MINFKKIGSDGYEVNVYNENDLLSLIKYLENIETNEPIEILYNEETYKLTVNLTEINNNIKFDNQKKEVILDLDMEDVEDWVHELEKSIAKKEFNPAELFEFTLKGKTIYTFMNIKLD